MAELTPSGLRRAGDHGLAPGGQPARAGYELTVFNRTREQAEAWVAEHGGARRRLARARSRSARTS